MRTLTVIACLGLAGCVTDIDLGSNTTPLAAPTPTKVSVTGALCTPVVESPVKLVIALDGSQSLAVTDPNGTRAAAVINLLSNLPQDPSVSVSVMMFGGGTIAWLTQGGTASFDQITALTPSERTQISQRILNFVPGAGDTTDFVGPLADIYMLLARDISQHVGPAETRARYEIVFLSDGAPTLNQDADLVCGDAVRRIRQLRDLTEDVRLHTIHVFEPALSMCSGDAGVVVDPACGYAVLPVGTCPKTIVEQNARRLARMAELGGGTFADFRDDTAVTFDFGTLAPVHRRLVLDKVVASNLSAPARSPAGVGDSDLDGLIDSTEIVEGTDPLVADSDGDGFSDGVEVYARDRSAMFDPLVVDVGCPVSLHALDTDCDGLFDCDEQLIGSNSQLLDSDDDGVPDSVEFKLGSQASSKDLAADPDQDSLSTGAELIAHLDPLTADTNPTSDYRYSVTKRAALEIDGSQCWDFSVTNLTLANTTSGSSELLVSYSMVWEDQPAGRTFLRSVRRVTAANVTLASGDFGVCQ